MPKMDLPNRAGAVQADSAHTAHSSPGAVWTINLAWLTWERLILVAAIGVGGFLRFLHLDLYPLSTLESGYAWSAWRIAEGLDPVWRGANPLFLSLQSLLFWLTGGGSDFWARFLGALAGLGSVFVVAKGKILPERTATLLLTVFVAVSPWHIALSRAGDGSAIAFFLGLLLISELIGRQTRLQAVVGQNLALSPNAPAGPFSDRWLFVLAGLLLIGGFSAWWFVLLLMGWSVANRAQMRSLFAEWRDHWPYVAGAVLLGATGWLARLDGLGGISSSFSVLLHRLGPEMLDLSTTVIPYLNSVGGDLGWVFWRLSTEQPLIVLLGLWGVVAGWGNARAEAGNVRPIRTDNPLEHLGFFSGWLGLGALLLLLPGRDIAALAFFSLPLYLFAAWLIAQVLQGLWHETDRLEAASVGLTLLILGAAGWVWLTGLSSSLLLDVTLIQAMIAIIGLVVVLVSLYGYWAGWGIALRLVLLLVVGLVLVGAVRSTWATSFVTQGSNPHGLAHNVTHSGVRRMVTELETLSAQRTGDPHKMFVYLEPGLLRTRPAGAASDVTSVAGWREEIDPVLAWYLRGFRNITFPHQVRIPAGDEPVAYITPIRIGGPTPEGPRSDGVFADTEYALRTLWTPSMPQWIDGNFVNNADRVQLAWGTVWRPLLRWYMHREPMTEPEQQRVRLRFFIGGTANTP